MRKYGTVLILALVWAAVTGATASFAGERADWGKVVCVGAIGQDAMILIENEEGIHTLVVEPYGELYTDRKQRTTLTSIKPGDHVDFAVTTWAGMQIVDLVVITSHKPLHLVKIQ
jgi:hypothetical protein